MCRRLPRWLAPVVVGLVLLVAAAALGWWSGRGPDVEPLAAPVSPASPSAAPSPSPAAVGPVEEVKWPQVLDELDAARASAFAAADPARLAEVYAADSPGLAGDRALVEQLAAAGQTASGVRHEVRDVQELSVSDDAARLRVVDVLAAYEVRDAAGAVVSTAPARGEAAYVVELVLTTDGWRLVQVTPD